MSAPSAVAAPSYRLHSARLDRAIQAHGGMGVSQDTPLAAMLAGIRTLRLADGPDEVHLAALGKHEIKRQRERRES